MKYAGRGTARIAPPDSLRFDYAGPFGLGSGAAVVIGDSVAWADPEQNFRSLVPAIPMLWAALRMVPPPSDDAVVFGTADTTGGARRVVWRFAAAEDTLDFVTTGGGAVLEAEWRQGGKVLARSRAQSTSARIDFPEASARFELTVGAVDSAAVIPPALWRSRR